MAKLITRESPPMDNEPHEFVLTHGQEETQTVVGYHEAVRVAKELSAADRVRVNVERDDGVVTMQFNDGSLDSYVWDTHKQR